MRRSAGFSANLLLVLALTAGIADALAREPKTARREPPRARIPTFSYEADPTHRHYLGFRPETDPVRRLNADAQERYLYSPLQDREQWFRTANERMLAETYRDRAIPLAQQLRDALLYVPITVGDEE
jgi:hypothetical protein